VIEAMALGVAPIVARYGGPSELVDDKTGIRIGFSDKTSLSKGLRDAIDGLVRSPEILDRLGAAGRRLVLEKLTWKAKANQFLALYDAVLGRGSRLETLDFGFGTFSANHSSRRHPSDYRRIESIWQDACR
jgi:glycosyltransferase involved in cell wall biosynthesis